MQQRYNLAHSILVSVVILALTLLLANVDVQAQIVFSSEMDGSWNIYVMDADGRNQQKLTNTRRGNWHPSWFGPAVAIVPAAVAPADKKITMWGWLKQVDQ